MKNDLTDFERTLLRVINLTNNTNYTYKNLMEWNSSKKVIEGSLQDGEEIYEAIGCFVAIKKTK